MLTVIETTFADKLRAFVAESSSESTRLGRHQAVESFLRYVGDRIDDVDRLNKRDITEWLIRMQAEGYSLKTIKYYLKHLSAAFSYIGERNEEIFSDISLGIKRIETKGEVSSLQDLRNFVRKLSSNIERNSMTENLALYSLLGGGMSAEALVKARCDSPLDEIEILDDIHDKYCRPRASYLFPLKQADRSLGAVAREVSFRVESLFQSYGLKGGADGLWAAAALKLDISPEVVRAVLGTVPACLSMLTLVEPIDISEDERFAAIELVAEALVDNPYRWFAMQMRHGTDFEDLMMRAKLDADNVYYPMHEVAKRVGHRLVKTRRPMLPGIVFFRARLTDIKPMFSVIGDLAWPYRLSNSPLSPYAIIPPIQMQAFQFAVGILPTETAGPETLRPGDQVEFIGGDFAGLRATLQSTAPDVYRLLLPALNGIPWQIDADPRLLRPSL